LCHHCRLVLSIFLFVFLFLVRCFILYTFGILFFFDKYILSVYLGAHYTFNKTVYHLTKKKKLLCGCKSARYKHNSRTYPGKNKCSFDCKRQKQASIGRDLKTAM